MPMSATYQPRRRAPPCHRDMDPQMTCPVGTLTEGTSPDVLQLCGPSELKGLHRMRRNLKEAKQQRPVMPLAASTEEAVRLKLSCLDRKLGGGMLTAFVGRVDVAQYILSFLEADRPLMDTAVGGKMFADSGSANVDLFFHSVPQGPCESVTHLEERLAKAWEENPEVCLKQIFLIGSSREGKQDRYSFYSALVWLWHKDPATLLANLHHIPECNYWKALLELLARLCEGPRRSLERDKALFGHYLRGQNLPEGLPGPAVAKGGRKILMKDAKVAEDCPGHVSWCPGSRLELAEAALKRYDADPLYRSLFERVGQLFAEQLSADLLHMKKGERISLCAKWCPLLQHSFDRRTLICESIARWLFPAARWKPQLTERHYAFRARDQLRKALGQLKEYMKCTERLMCQNRWAEIQYRKVHATCLAQNAKLFEKNDPLRFQRFIDQLTKRKGKANVGALQPHQLLKTILTSSTAFERVLAQAQWRALVERLRSAGNLSNSIAVCDVSGSMSSTAAPGVSRMDVAISMSLLLAELASSTDF